MLMLQAGMLWKWLDDMAKTYGVTNEVRFILWFSR